MHTYIHTYINLYIYLRRAILTFRLSSKVYEAVFVLKNDESFEEKKTNKILSIFNHTPHAI